MKKNVLILCGGKSEEHEISLISAKYVLSALDRKLYSPVVVGISKKGVWHLENEESFYVGEVRADKIRLNENCPTISISPFLTKNGRGSMHSGATSIEFDVVFPILHGPFGEDGTLQGMLDTIGIPYVGSNCGSSWICMDKVLTKILCQKHAIRVTDFVEVRELSDLESKKLELLNLGDLLFVKPARLGSSVGISRVERMEGLPKAVEYALRYDTKVLVERAVVGREFECAVLGLNGSPRASLPGEIIPNPKIGFYSYDAKYLLADGAELHAPADLGSKLVKRIQEFCIKVYQILECDGMARIDLFLESATDTCVLNEANTIPGFTPISMYPKLWQASGLTYTQLITELLELAFRRASRVSSP